MKFKNFRREPSLNILRTLLALVAPIISLWLTSTPSHAKIININNQEQFDDLEETILSLISNGETNIDIHLAPTTFYFGENHLNLNNIKNNQHKTAFSKINCFKSSTFLTSVMIRTVQNAKMLLKMYNNCKFSAILSL